MAGDRSPILRRRRSSHHLRCTCEVLRSGQTCFHLALASAIADSLGRHVRSPADRSWLGDFRDRYLNLNLSEELLDLDSDE
jgi:hypothetical protein